jgi:hypothetical protein
MKPEQIYNELKNLAEKLEIKISEQNLRKTGIHVNSGLCKIKGEKFIILDKNEKVFDKIEIISSILCEMPHEDIYLIPAVRELLNKKGKKI